MVLIALETAAFTAGGCRRGGRWLAQRLLLPLLLLGMLVSCEGCGRGVTQPQAADVATAFLEAIRQGQVTEAWQETSTDFKSAMGHDRIKVFVKSQPVLRESSTLFSEGTVEVQGRPYHRCLFTPASGRKQVVVLLRAERAGDWKVERLLVED